MVGETLSPHVKLKRFGAHFWWPTGTTMSGSCFVPEAGPEQPRVRSWEPGTAGLPLVDCAMTYICFRGAKAPWER